MKRKRKFDWNPLSKRNEFNFKMILIGSFLFLWGQYFNLQIGYMGLIFVICLPATQIDPVTWKWIE
jgi:hypothetical protein